MNRDQRHAATALVCALLAVATFGLVAYCFVLLAVGSLVGMTVRPAER